MKKDLLIFLDFDGVLHHIFPLRENTDQQNEKFYYIDNFERTIKNLKNDFNIKIVFSTSWKEKFSYEDLKSFFEDYLNCYQSFIGCTPNIKSETDESYKWKEASEWLKENNYQGNYIILDDVYHVWKGCNQKDFILCKDRFSDEEIEAVLKTTCKLLKNHNKKIPI